MAYFTAEYDALTTQKKINVLETELATQYNNKHYEDANAQTIIEAETNAYNAMFDGVKYVSSPENALTFTSPMKCKANVFYQTLENDGIKDIAKIYVCMPQDGTTDPIVTDENFDQYMVAWDLEDAE